MKAILFDFDGVVIKSMEQHFKAWKSSFKEQGVDLREEDFFILEGQGIHTIAKQLGEEYGLKDGQIEKVLYRKLHYYNQFMSIEFYDYFPEMLQGLKDKSIPMGVVTGGSKPRILRLLFHLPRSVSPFLMVYF